MEKIDKCLALSQYLAFRYVFDDVVFSSKQIGKRQHYKRIPNDAKTLVGSAEDTDIALRNTFRMISHEKLGILLSGGMDSAILATYMPKGSDAYTFRFIGGEFAQDELERAEMFAKYCDLNLHYVDIDWNIVEGCVDICMHHKGAPVHSIEPQLYNAAKQAKADGATMLVIGDGADYVFGGMFGLYGKNWSYDEFVKRYIYIDPKDVLVEPSDINPIFEPYRLGPNSIDFIRLLDEICVDESYASYDNALEAAEMCFIDPYDHLKLSHPLDLSRLRNGDPKYIIRELYRMRYCDLPVPQKNPMPRPVDKYFAEWAGPVRPEFKKNIDLSSYSGNKKWLLWCAERYLNIIEK